MHVVPALFDAADGILGGAERYVLELARHMADRVPTTLVTFGSVDRRTSVGALQVRVIGKPRYVRGQRTNPFALRLLGELRRASVVHCHQQHIVASSMAALAGRLSNKRVFVTELGGGGWDISGYVSTDRWYRAHLHISEFSRRVAGQAGWERARVIFGGVDTAKFSPNGAPAADGPILFVGRLLPHKGLDYLIEALPDGATLEVIGQSFDDSYTARLRQLASGKDVHFRHDCGDAELVDAYRRARCIVLPSLYRSATGSETPVPELLGQALLEGMACGTPAICTDVASMPEIVVHGVTGLVVPPNDVRALRQALVDIGRTSERHCAMSVAARQRVLDQFTWPDVVDRCLAAYAT